MVSYRQSCLSSYEPNIFVGKFKVEGCKDCVKYWLEKWRDKTKDITKQNTKYVLYNDTLNIWTRLQS